MREMKKRLISSVLALALLLASLLGGGIFGETTAQAASIPKIKASITEKNVMKILNKYDKDGAYVVKKAKAAGDKNLMTWFSGADRIIEQLDTAVHEQTHAYSFEYGLFGFGVRKTAFFVGNGQTIKVTHTDVYKSKKMAKTIPSSLRTFRYKTYIGSPTANLASNVDGAYGIMNEFMAYFMGMNNTVKLYPYLASQNASFNDWGQYLNAGENNKLAYAEMKYYTLHYLYYAKNHYPKVYKGIMNNKKFCKVYYLIEKRYKSRIKTYNNQLPKMAKRLSKKGAKCTVNSQSIIYRSSGGSYSGWGRVTKDYNKLVKAMKASKYKSIHNKLVKKAKS